VPVNSAGRQFSTSSAVHNRLQGLASDESTFRWTSSTYPIATLSLSGACARTERRSFGTALGNVNTPETQQADDDLAVGRLVQAVAESPYAADTLIIITEDDCQDGPDHVDSHRATTYVIGPYLKQVAVITTRYSPVNALRTIEDIHGTEHMNLNTHFQGPMADVFDIHSSGRWSFVAEASTILKTTQLAKAPGGLGVQYARGEDVKPKHDAQYWPKATVGFDFSDADRVTPEKFNRVLWKGLMGDRPYPKSFNHPDTKDRDD
jgi:hypothetical protein